MPPQQCLYALDGCGSIGWRGRCLTRAAGAQQPGVQWLAYESARASGQRCAVVFDPDCLAEPAGGLDHTLQTWHCKATRASVMFTRGRERHEWHF